ncbi:dihydropteroate synthase [Rarobacter faecitabidus]
MGILNVTPDSFSDGGDWFGAQAAVDHGLAMALSGADIIDVGGESTRPGAQRVSEDEELGRVLPVVRALADRGVAVSIDTMRASVAGACVAAGAVIVNDVSGGLADADMFATVASLGVPYVLSHWRAHSTDMDDHDRYDDVVVQVRAELARRAEEFIAAGGNPGQLVLDPGLGFAKATDSNWPLLARLDELESLGFPILIGASRKRFLAAALSTERAPAQRDTATAVVTAIVAQRPVWAVRVHDVAGSIDAISVVTALQKAGMTP